MRCAVAVVLSLLLSCSSTLAFAADEPEPAPSRTWYGWQGLGVDLLAVGMFAASMTEGVDGDADPLAWGALGVYLVGTPLVHLAHGGPVGKSLGLRLGLPVGTALLFAAGTAVVNRCGPESGELCEAAPLFVGIFGAGLGAVGAMLVDDVDMSYEAAPATWTPMVSPTTGGMTLGLAGTW
jgi:hypothetical protein